MSHAPRTNREAPDPHAEARRGSCEAPFTRVPGPSRFVRRASSGTSTALRFVRAALLLVCLAPACDRRASPSVSSEALPPPASSSPTPMTPAVTETPVAETATLGPVDARPFLVRARDLYPTATHLAVEGNGFVVVAMDAAPTLGQATIFREQDALLFRAPSSHTRRGERRSCQVGEGQEPAVTTANVASATTEAATLGPVRIWVWLFLASALSIVQSACHRNVEQRERESPVGRLSEHETCTIVHSLIEMEAPPMECTWSLGGPGAETLLPSIYDATADPAGRFVAATAALGAPPGHLWVLDGRTGARLGEQDLPLREASPEWAPDSSALAMHPGCLDQESGLYVVAIPARRADNHD